LLRDGAYAIRPYVGRTASYIHTKRKALILTANPDESGAKGAKKTDRIALEEPRMNTAVLEGTSAGTSDGLRR
jgi:hypothetical protein